MQNCLFCKIIQKEIPANIVYEDTQIVAITDIDPISEGHTLIIPKKHIQDLYVMEEEIGSHIMKTAKILANAIKDEFNFDGIMIMEVNGPFQDVPHFHLHVFGRNKNNDIEISYPDNTNNSYQFLSKNAQRIKKRLSN